MRLGRRGPQLKRERELVGPRVAARGEPEQLEKKSEPEHAEPAREPARVNGGRRRGRGGRRRRRPLTAAGRGGRSGRGVDLV